MVWRFFCGILFRKLPIRIATCNTEIEVNKVIDVLQRNRRLGSWMMLCHCAFEADYKPVNDEIAQFYKRTSIPTPNTTHDCTAILHLLRSMNNRKRLEIKLNNYASSNVIASLADVLAIKCGKLQVKSMYFHSSTLTDNDMCYLFSTAVVAIQSLKRLELNNNDIRTASFMSMLVTQSLLAHLDLSFNPLGVSGVLCLDSAMCSGTLSHLEKLILRHTLTSDQDINGALLTTLCNALSTHCHHFHYLDLSQNNLGIPGAQAIGSVLHCIATQEKGLALELRDTNLQDEGVGAFIQSLDNTSCLRSLQLSCNDIHATGASRLIDSGKLSFLSLDLSDNPLGFEISEVLIKMPVKCLSLTMCRCQLTDSPIRNIDMPQACTISSLYLDGNNFNGESIYVLTHFIYLCPKVRHLSCIQCGITSTDLRQLFLQLSKPIFSSSSVGELMIWNLRNNEVDDSGVSVLIEYLPLLRKCSHIFIDGNPASLGMQTKLQQETCVSGNCCTIIWLYKYLQVPLLVLLSVHSLF